MTYEAKHRNILAPIFLGVILVLMVQAVFAFSLWEQRNNVAAGIQALLRREDLARNPYLFSLALADFESLKIISCTKIALEGDQPKIFMDSTFKSNCERVPDLFFGIDQMNVLLESSNGAVLRLEATLVKSSTFYVALWLSRLLVIVLVWIGWKVYQLEMLKDKLSREVEVAQLKAIQDLSIEVAHDIQSPLASLKTVIQEINLGLSAEYSAVSAEALDRLSDLSITLLGKTEENSKRPIGRWLSDFVKSKETEIKNVSGSIKLSVEGSLNDKILPGSVFSWKRVLSNLINNAVESYGKFEEKPVSISFHRNTANLEIIISDGGRGISEEELTTIKSGKRKSSKPLGFGVGVAAAKKFLQSVGSKLVIRSEVGTGTSVIISIPLIDFTKSAVLIDDDRALIEIWKIAAKARHLRLKCFSSVYEFKGTIDSVERDANLFLDLSVFESEEAAHFFGLELRQFGFKSIWICSGKSKVGLEYFSWAQGIVGKEPPWL